MVIQDSEKGPIPCLVAECKNCSLCILTCPGKYVNFEELNKYIFGKHSDLPLGFLEKIFVSYSNKDTIRSSASSGGAATQILISLFKNKLISKAVILGFNKQEPWRSEIKIAETEKDLIAGSGSKYVVSSINTILKEIKEDDEQYALVALPCQVHAVRKLQAIPQGSGFENIKFIIGLYCGNNLFKEATLSLINKLGIKRLNNIKQINYRAGKWPGRFEITLFNGKKKSVSKMLFNYLSFLYTPERCTYCIDLTNELADISIGDAWGYQAHSVIICRNKRILGLIEDFKLNGDIELKEITIHDAIRMHSHGLDNKKTGALARINISSLRGIAVPEYSKSIIKITYKRLLFEKFLMFVFEIGRKNYIRNAVNCVPVFILEKTASVIRYIWKKTSQKKI